MAEKEILKKQRGLKPKVDRVFLISIVGVDKDGFVAEHEHIFDIFTKFGLNKN